jgi:hypothetical protein
MKKILFLLLLAFCIEKNDAQQIAYNLPRPLKWGTERLPIPIDFAPKIPLKGYEELRFAPGWNNSKGGEYWAYVFLWFIHGKPWLHEDTLNNYLTQYYNGLYLSNLKNKTNAPSNFTKTNVTSIHRLLNDAETYEGQVTTLDFLNGKPITFNIRIHLRNYPQINRTALLFEVAPQDYKQPVWIMMNNIVAGFSVKDDNYY